MAYEYDIFISYRRHPETRLWLAEHFVPLLELRVGFELGRNPRIFVDDQIDSGTSWPVSLGGALGRSRVLMLLWSANYLASQWCAHEFAHMLLREQEQGLRSPTRPHGVIIPAFIHDGDRFPKEVRHIQHFEIQRTFNVRMARTSTLAEELDAILTREAPAIARCINNAPVWRPTWPDEAANTLFQQFYQTSQPKQETVPRFTTS
jgi:hypothetical protein